MTLNVLRSRSFPMTSALLLCAALSLGACSKRTAQLESGVDPVETASIKPRAGEPSFKKTRDLSAQWGKNQGDMTIGMAFAKSLAELGQAEQQVEVYKTLSTHNRANPKAQAEIGKELLKLGKAGPALPMLELAAADPGVSWQTLSALGSAYDQQGRYKLAREKYQAALVQSPKNASVLNNMAMSHSLEGDLKKAESVLRDALDSAGAVAGNENFNRVRQNLALVVGLQGRFDEARKIASEDLPQDQVEANLAYLEKMLSQQNTWAKLQDEAAAQ
jgi:Flp pilus assembly protein TadD